MIIVDVDLDLVLGVFWSPSGFGSVPPPTATDANDV